MKDGDKEKEGKRYSRAKKRGMRGERAKVWGDVSKQTDISKRELWKRKEKCKREKYKRNKEGK